MEIFEKIGKKATSAYKVTASKTEKITKDFKIKMKTQELKDKKEDIYLELGELIHKNYIDKDINKEIIDILDEKCKEIDRIEKEIEDLIKEQLALNNTKKCDNCTKEIEIEFEFCPNCGYKQKNDIKIENDEESKNLQESIKEELQKEDNTKDILEGYVVNSDENSGNQNQISEE